MINNTPDVSSEFLPQAKPLYEFFSDSKGLYIPLYQRPYSWNPENIEQLMDDLSKGVESTLNSSNSITFLGTVILCAERNKTKNIRPIEERALPQSVYNIIDGQQRISTIAILATRLYRAIYFLAKPNRGIEKYNELVDHLDSTLEKLEPFFSFTHSSKKATPRQKPIIIRGNEDQWIFSSDKDEKYKSIVSNYLANFIRSLESGGCDIPDKRTIFGRNLRKMDLYIDAIINAHDQQEQHIQYPCATKIAEKISEELIWNHSRDDYITALKRRSNEGFDFISSVVQISTFIHYLFERACLSIVQPSSEEWAFDIFQSLNSTGTPLTAIETFKPLVINTHNQNQTIPYQGSTIESHVDSVDLAFDSNDSAEKKIKKTKEILTHI